MQVTGLLSSQNSGASLTPKLRPLRYPFYAFSLQAAIRGNGIPVYNESHLYPKLPTYFIFALSGLYIFVTYSTISGNTSQSYKKTKNCSFLSVSLTALNNEINGISKLVHFEDLVQTSTSLSPY